MEARPGEQVRILAENEPETFSKGRVGTVGMVGKILTDDQSDQPLEILFPDGKTRWYKRTWVQVIRAEMQAPMKNDSHSKEGHEGYSSGTRKEMWSTIHKKSDGYKAAQSEHKVWSDISSGSEFCSSAASASGSRNNSSRDRHNQNQEYLQSLPADSSETASSCTERELLSEYELEHVLPQIEVEPHENVVELSKYPVRLPENIIQPIGAEVVNVEPASTKKKKKKKKEDTRNRPPKAQRGHAKKLAIMLFEASTDEDREAAEIAFMQATEQEPLLYHYAMSVFQRLRLEGEGKPNLASAPQEGEEEDEDSRFSL